MDSEAETSADGENQNAQPHYPDLIDIVREQGPGPDAGTGAPDADGDRDRGLKASTPPTSPGSFIDGVVPPRDLRLQHQREHPELVEDLKVFLGLKSPTTLSQQVLQAEPPAPSALESVELADPSLTKLPQPALETVELADPYRTKPPQPACAAEAMSAHDGQAPGSEPEPQPAGDAPSSVLDCAALAAPEVAMAVAGPSRHDRDAADGDLRHGAHTAPCTHGRGDASVEDKCLECCVYYGVMCCQCTIS